MLIKEDWGNSRVIGVLVVLHNSIYKSSKCVVHLITKGAPEPYLDFEMVNNYNFETRFVV